MWAWLVQDCFVWERKGDIWKRMGNDGKDCLGAVGAVCGYIGREGREIGMWEKVSFGIWVYWCISILVYQHIMWLFRHIRKIVGVFIRNWKYLEFIVLLSEGFWV